MSAPEVPGSGPVAPEEALYQRCVREAAAAARPLMERLVDQARGALLAQAEQLRYTQRREVVGDALALLEKYRVTLVRRLPDELIQRALSGGSLAPGRATSLRFDQLELMDDDQVQERVESARALQAAALEVDEQLAELNALICAIQGLDTVQPERNPIRPEVFVKALTQVIAQTQVRADVRMVWLQHMGTALGKGLQDVYGQVIELLHTAGVQAAGYAIRQAEGPPVRASRPSASAAVVAGRGGAPGEGWSGGGVQQPALDPSVLTVQRLRDLVSGQFDPRQHVDRRQPNSRPTSAEKWGRRASDHNLETVPAALEALEELGQVDALVQRLEQVLGQADGQGLRLQSLRPVSPMGQRVAEEVVQLMLENITADPRLLPPLRDELARLRPSLVALSRIDPRFFSDRQHPARRLLEAITQRGLAFNDPGHEAFAEFLAPLREAVDVLNQVQIRDAEPFELALHTLTEAWNEQAEQEESRRKAAVKALLHAEQRNMLADKLVPGLRRRAREGKAPGVVGDFLAGPWSQVLAHVQLSSDLPASVREAMERVVDEVLWSIRPSQVKGQSERLIRLIPHILSTLRQGLRLVGYPDDEAAKFFNELVKLHRFALRTSLLNKKEAEAEEAAAPESYAQTDAVVVPPAERPTTPDTADVAASWPESVPWLGPQETVATGFMDDLPAGAPAPMPDSSPASLYPVDSGTVLERLRIGVWVDLLRQGERSRLQLTWQSPHQTMFMFTGMGGETHSMTRRLLERLWNESRLVIVADQQVLDGALDAVAQIALRNSVRADRRTD